MSLHSWTGFAHRAERPMKKLLVVPFVEAGVEQRRPTQLFARTGLDFSTEFAVRRETPSPAQITNATPARSRLGVIVEGSTGIHNTARFAMAHAMSERPPTKTAQLANRVRDFRVPRANPEHATATIARIASKGTTRVEAGVPPI